MKKNYTNMNNQKWINKLVGKNIYILSPHLDDAVLSCGQLIKELSDRSNMTVINIFTKAHHGPYTLSAKKYLSQCGKYSDAEKLYKDRIKEDKKALNMLGVKNIINLDLTDALFRKSRQQSPFGNILPEFNHLYPTYRYHVIGKYSKCDDSVNTLITKFQSIIKQNAYVFVPLNIANHIDHQITKKAAEKLNNKIIHYLEYPYISKNIHLLSKYQFSLPINITKKTSVIKKYKTQQKPLFPDSIIPNINEYYSYNKKKHIYQVLTHANITNNLELEWKYLWKKSNQATIFNSVEWYKTFCKVYKPQEKLIITIKKKNELIGICAFVKEKMFGFNLFIMPGAKYSQRSCFLFKSGNKRVKKYFINKISKIGNVLLTFQDKKDTKAYIKTEKNIFITKIINSPYLILNKNNDGNLILSKKNQILKKARNDEKHFKLLEMKNHQKGLSICFNIDKYSSKSYNNYNVFHDKKLRNFYKLLCQQKKDTVNIFILYHKNKPIAYEVGFVNNYLYIDSERAYLKNYEYCTPGKVMLVKIAELLAKNNYSIFDLGPGEDNLKKAITSKKNQFFNCVIINNALKRQLFIGINKLKQYMYNKIFQIHILYKMYKCIYNITTKYS